MKPVYGVYRHCDTPYEADEVVGYYAHLEDATYTLEIAMLHSLYEGELWRIREWVGRVSSIIEERRVPTLEGWGV